jgi:formamidopyrimidine-DNA glycosylase
MPELPEVETIKNELAPDVTGRTITGVTIFWERMLRQPPLAEFEREIAGRKILKLGRRGKYLIFHLSGGKDLLFHLKMSGSLLTGKGEPPKYTRAIIRLDDGTSIFFRDPRKFGTLQLVDDANSFLCKLGPEPLEPAFTARVLQDILCQRKAPVKAVLVDQAIIAGIGNMYADEALFSARIHPLRPARSLSTREIKRLHAAIREVLIAAIESKGASVASYFRPGGQTGGAQNGFRVAHRGGQPCPICGGRVQRIVVRGRGTYFCPKCQPEA